MGSNRMVRGLALVAVVAQAMACTTARVVTPVEPSSSSPVVQQGDRVRIQMAGYPRSITATVDAYSLEKSAITLREGQRDAFVLPLHEIERATVFRESHQPNWAQVKRAWLMGGAVAGSLVLIALPLDDRCDGFLCISSRDLVMALGAVGGLGLAPGGTVGGLLGKEEIWEEVELTGLRPSVRVSGKGGVGLDLSILVGK